jgi:hypothetical protein
MVDALNIVRRRRKSLRTSWSNRFLVGLGRIISLNLSNFFEFVDFCSFFSM